LEVVSRGDFLIQGCRNRDIREALHGSEKLPVEEQRRQSAAIRRQLRLLQAHELIKKQAHSHRYQLTEQGQRAIAALLAACRANAAKLIETAA
jgi:DNA-binding HxlR family transcriptional regulator